MSTIKRNLYGFPPGTTSLIPIIAAQEANVPIDVHRITFGKENKEQNYLNTVHPMGKIPGYNETNENGEVVFSMYESRAIARYMNVLGNNILGPNNKPHEIAEFEQFAYFEATSVTPIVSKIISERFYAPLMGRPVNAEASLKASEEVRPYLKVLNDQLTKTNEYICGKFTLVDIYFYVYFKYVQLHGKEEWPVWEEFPSLIAWFNRVSERPVFKKTDFTLPKTN